MAPIKRTVNRAATDRLKRMVETELARQELSGEEIAREARLPAKAFRSLLRHGHRPTLDRAEELCTALGLTMTIGKTRTSHDATDVAGNEAEGGAEQ